MASYESNRGLRDALGRFPTGVAIVTARVGDTGPVGMTINSFASVSLEPALVSWCIGRDAASHGAFTGAGEFAITVLAQDQAELAARFASRGADKFRGIDTRGTDAPLIPGGSAWFRCETCRGITLGDHTLLVGRVIDYGQGAAAPLVFGAGRFQRLAPAAEADRRAAA